MHTRSTAPPFTMLAAVLTTALITTLAMGPGDGTLRCMPAWQPARAALVKGETGLAVDRVRLFAPIRQAVFFSRSGDRCGWRGGGLARG